MNKTNKTNTKSDDNINYQSAKTVISDISLQTNMSTNIPRLTSVYNLNDAVEIRITPGSPKKINTETDL